MHRLSRVAILAAVLAALPACTSSASDPRPRVAFVSNNPADFWTIAEAGCKQAESEFGDVKVEFRKPDKADAGVQQTVVKSLVNSGYKAVAVSVINPEGQTAFIDEIAARAPFFAIDNDAPDSKRVCYVGTDNYKAGRDAGKLVKEALPKGGTVAIFVGQIEPLNSRQRTQGVLDELAGVPYKPELAKPEHPDHARGPMYGAYKLYGQSEAGSVENPLHFKAVLTDRTESAVAKSNVSGVLRNLSAEPDVCCVGIWAPNAPAILSAVEDAKKLGQVKIVGFDENTITLDGIEAGHIHGTIVQQPFLFGKKAVELMRKAVKGEPAELSPDSQIEAQGKLYFVKHRVIKKDGVPEADTATAFKKELAKLLGK